MEVLQSIHIQTMNCRLSSARSLGNALRRRLWRGLYASRQNALGTFFLDTHDHIGAERIILGDYYEGHILAVLDQLVSRLKLQHGIAIDIGANIGNHAAWFVCRFEHVICVEPGQIASLVLEANLLATGRKNWEIHRCALGKRDGSGSLDVTNPRNLGASVVHETDGPGEFAIVKGDTLWRKFLRDGRPVTLVKIDVEGGELDVLGGMLELLATEHPVVCIEVLGPEKWKTVAATLANLGYVDYRAIVPRAQMGGVLGRAWASLRGRSWRLVRLPEVFPAGGYEMVVCLPERYAAMLEC